MRNLLRPYFVYGMRWVYVQRNEFLKCLGARVTPTTSTEPPDFTSPATPLLATARFVLYRGPTTAQEDQASGA